MTDGDGPGGDGAADGPGGPNRLWYTDTPDEWVEALPVGSGRLGAMVFGYPETDRLQLNEEHLWAGERTTPRESAGDHVDEVRELLLAGEHERAHEVADEHLLGEPRRLRPYQSLGELSVTFPGHEEPTAYRRALDLETGVASVDYEHGGTRFERTCFASRVDDVVVYRVTADAPGAIDARVAIDRERDARATAVDGTEAHTPGEHRELVLRGQVLDLPEDEHGAGGWGTRFEGRVRARVEDGTLAVDEDADELVVEDATTLTLLVGAVTGATADDPTEAVVGHLDAAGGKGAPALRADHVADHRDYFDRFAIELGRRVGGGGGESAAPGTAAAPGDRPTDERIAAVADGASDPALAALYVQVARYLMVSSSRPGGLPATLQGLWNEEMVPAWNSGFTTNLNVQMNYWSVEQANLADCAEPLVELIDSLRPSGRETASTQYDADGWCVHHNTDRWGSTTPVDGVWGLWPLAGAWLCRHLWDHFAFSRDEQFLAETAYPIMKEACAFALDYLVETVDDETGEVTLHTAPSVSPENIFVGPDGHEGWLCVSPTVDVVVLRELFGNTAAAAERLDRDPSFRRTIADAREDLRDVEIGDDGRLLEWREPYDEHYPGHRHLSHLYGSYPGDQITPDATPELAAATRESIEYRLDHGSGSTGWSQAWLVNQFARLRDPAAVGEHVRTLLGEYTADSMLDLHPPFQIDGNFGGAAGVLECLVQSHADELDVLPALPPAWDAGRVEGLRARGGFELDLAWDGGTPTAMTVHSTAGERCTIRAADAAAATVTTADGESVDVTVEDAAGIDEERIAFETAAGDSYRVAW